METPGFVRDIVNRCRRVVGMSIGDDPIQKGQINRDKTENERPENERPENEHEHPVKRVKHTEPSNPECESLVEVVKIMSDVPNTGCVIKRPGTKRSCTNQSRTLQFPTCSSSELTDVELRYRAAGYNPLIVTNQSDSSVQSDSRSQYEKQSLYLLPPVKTNEHTFDETTTMSVRSRRTRAAACSTTSYTIERPVARNGRPTSQPDSFENKIHGRPYTYNPSPGNSERENKWSDIPPNSSRSSEGTHFASRSDDGFAGRDKLPVKQLNPTVPIKGIGHRSGSGYVRTKLHDELLSTLSLRFYDRLNDWLLIPVQHKMYGDILQIEHIINSCEIPIKAYECTEKDKLYRLWYGLSQIRDNAAIEQRPMSWQELYDFSINFA